MAGEPMELTLTAVDLRLALRSAPFLESKNMLAVSSAFCVLKVEKSGGSSLSACRFAFR